MWYGSNRKKKVWKKQKLDIKGLKRNFGSGRQGVGDKWRMNNRLREANRVADLFGIGRAWMIDDALN